MRLKSSMPNLRGQMMENHDFDETTERHYSPGIGMWMPEWDNDPTVWQIPSAETPYGESLSAEYDQLYGQTETKTLVDVVMEQPAFQQASSQFRRYLEALVVARQAQMAPDRLMVVEDDQFRQLPMSQQYKVAQQLQQDVETVFSWMKEQGMDPIPQETVSGAVHTGPGQAGTGRVLAGEPVDWSGQSLRPSGFQARLDANIAALETLQTLEAGSQYATTEQQQVLAGWSSWGALPEVFDPSSDRVSDGMRERVRDLLGEDG